MVDVVVLTADLAIFEATRHAVGERNPVWRARSAEESVELLLTGRCGVLLIDMAAVTAKPAALVEQIVDQFPDVVVVVAGRREDESLLAGLISDGLVYRFMHKPLSPKRAGMFLGAAIRAHVERREGRVTEPLLPLVRELKSRVDPRKWLFVGGGLIVFLAVLAAILIARYVRPPVPDPAEVAASRSAIPSAPLADPVLSRARAALAAGRYESPPGRNALDLYSAVLLTRPDDAEARRGFQATIERLVASAERAAAAGDAVEARRIAQRVLQADSGNAAARTVLARLQLPRPAPTAVVEPVAPSLPADAGTTPARLRPAEPPPVDDADRLDRVPVTRLAPVPAAAPPPPPAAAPVARVQPDPLTARVVGTGTLPTAQSRRSLKTPLRYYPGPTAPALPIAGYEKRAPEPVAAASVATEPGVQQRDLEPVATPGPTYPATALRQGLGGWVEVEYTVDERGATTDVTVVAAEPRGVFDEAAVAAVAGWKYRPRVVNGRPVAQRTSVTLQFNVED
jgi:protein TonB